jgi:integrase
VLVTTFGSLRWGEVTALRRCDVDVADGVVHLSTAFTRRYSGEVVCGAPKSRASTRAVALPGPVVELLAEHLADNVGDDWAALVFTGDKGGPLHRGKLQSAGALG